MFDYFNKVDDNFSQKVANSIQEGANSLKPGIGTRAMDSLSQINPFGKDKNPVDAYDAAALADAETFGAVGPQGYGLITGAHKDQVDAPDALRMNADNADMIRKQGGLDDNEGGLPWKDIMGSAFQALSQIGTDESTVRSSAFRPSFKGVSIPAGQFDAGALQNSMAAQEFQQQAASNNGSIESLLASLSK